MAADYDSQLIESVAVRRNRLLTALLYGSNPLQRRWADGVRTFFYSVAVAALVAAVCVGYSFVSNLLAQQNAKQQQQEQDQQRQQQLNQQRQGAPAPGRPGGVVVLPIALTLPPTTAEVA
ncbi:hypothetical protein V6N00_10955 [Tersicoccus sp. MR15.9]|uniref:hypothetical protein n=1 Tax=Tersicoccus mangrovi TaxID=3121635 RepID=UPI002FE6C080